MNGEWPLPLVVPKKVTLCRACWAPETRGCEGSRVDIPEAGGRRRTPRGESGEGPGAETVMMMMSGSSSSESRRKGRPSSWAHGRKRLPAQCAEKHWTPARGAAGQDVALLTFALPGPRDGRVKRKMNERTEREGNFLFFLRVRRAAPSLSRTAFYPAVLFVFPVFPEPVTLGPWAPFCAVFFSSRELIASIFLLLLSFKTFFTRNSIRLLKFSKLCCQDCETRGFFKLLKRLE